MASAPQFLVCKTGITALSYLAEGYITRYFKRLCVLLDNVSKEEHQGTVVLIQSAKVLGFFLFFFIIVFL